MLEPGDRVRVTTMYGARFPAWQGYLGAAGTVLEVIEGGLWNGYVRAHLDCDDGPGYFAPDELELWPSPSAR